MSEVKRYKIGQVAELLQLDTHVLRFWESKFPQLEPSRTDKGQRFYTETHIILLKQIQQLLHVRGMTIKGALRFLEENGNAHGDLPESVDDDSGFMRMVEEELIDIRKLLARSEQR